MADSFLSAVKVEPDLRIACLPVVNMLPLYFAQDAGYFDQAGVSVELVLFSNAPAGQSAILAGEVDGLSTGLLGGLWLNDNGADVRVVRHRRVVDGVFAIVAGPESGLKSAGDLVGASIAITPVTLVQYTTDKLLESVGIDAAEVEYVGEGRILERFSYDHERRSRRSYPADAIQWSRQRILRCSYPHR